MTQQAYNFEREIGARRTNLASEFWAFLRDNKKWWLLPIILVFMLVGVLLVLGGTAAAPFIYTLF
jgi:hypothetical protein